MPGREDKDEVDARTIFVRNLSFETNDAKLEECFSDIGPVRECFVVTKPGEKTHRGFGFVQFAIKEDAERAVKERHGYSLDRREIKVEIAKKRDKLDKGKMRGKRGEEAEGAEEEAEGAGAVKKEAKKAPKKKAPQPESDGEEEEEEEEEEEDEEEKPAKKESKKESKPAPKDKAKDKARAKKEGLSSSTQQRARTVALGGLTAAAKAAAVKEARRLGAVDAVEDPCPAEEVARGRLAADGCPPGGEKGHEPPLLVVYKSTKVAQAAASALHGKKFGKGAVAWARQLGGDGAHLKKWRLIVRNLPFKASRQDMEKAFAPLTPREVTLPKKPNGQSKGFAFIGFNSQAEALQGIEIRNGKEINGRPVAVDFSVSKREYDEAMARVGGDGDAGGDASGGEGSDSDDEGVGGSSSDGEGEGEEEGDTGKERDMMRGVLGDLMREEEGSEGGSEGEGEGEESEGESEGEGDAGGAEGKAWAGEKAVAPPAFRAPPSGPAPNTVFVVGIPPAATQAQLEEALAKFGLIKSARLVLHPQTKKPKGTAFVDFETPEGAEKCVKAAAKPDGVMVAGRGINAKAALNKDGIRKLADEKAKETEANKDKRNIYLAKEGVIEEDTPAYEGMSKSDRTKRARAAAESRSKLANPNFFISPTRLMIRNIPTSHTERALASLCVRAVKKHATKQDPRIVQCKILKDEEKGKSKGRGFVEFGEHQHALVALRQLNNNPEAFSKDARPIVEFAIESQTKVKILEKLRSTRAAEQKATGTSAEPVDFVAKQKKKKLGRKEREKLKRRELLGEAGGGGGGGGGEGGEKKKKKRDREGEGEGEGEGDGDDAGGGKGGEGGEKKKQKPKRVKREPREPGKAAVKKPAAGGEGKGAGEKGPAEGAGAKGVAKDEAPKPKPARGAARAAAQADADRVRLGLKPKKRKPEGDKPDPKRAKLGPAPVRAPARPAAPAAAPEPMARGDRRAKKKKAAAQEEGLDSLVKDYKNKFFSAGGAAKKDAGAASKGSALSRWFD